jgi:hypothetical protein
MPEGNQPHPLPRCSDPNPNSKSGQRDLAAEACVSSLMVEIFGRESRPYRSPGARIRNASTLSSFPLRRSASRSAIGYISRTAS